MVPPTIQVLPPVPAPALQVVDVDLQGTTIVPPSLAPVSLILPAEPFKLPAIADAKAYLNLLSIIQYYLRHHEFSSQHPDNALITDSWNVKASAYWEGQIRVAVQDGSLHFLFENKGAMYNMMGRASRWLVCLIGTAAPTPLLTFLLPSCCVSTTVWASQKKSWLSDRDSTAWLMTWPSANLHSLHSCYDNLLAQFCCL
jgi:hypothetical protein